MIESTHNPQLKELRRIQARRVPGLFACEGEDLVAAAAETGRPAVRLLRAGIEVDGRTLERVSELGSGSRVIGVYEERWTAPSGPLCVALWGVGDPGNVGTVLRSAHAFGASSVVIGPGTADPYSGKATRASMGAIFRVPVARAGALAELPGTTVALDGGGATAITEAWPQGPVTLIVGAERDGLPAAVLAAAGQVRRIEIQGDSLNAAMAATVALYERSRVQSA